MQICSQSRLSVMHRSNSDEIAKQASSLEIRRKTENRNKYNRNWSKKSRPFHSTFCREFMPFRHTHVKRWLLRLVMCLSFAFAVQRHSYDRFAFDSRKTRQFINCNRFARIWETAEKCATTNSTKILLNRIACDENYYVLNEWTLIVYYCARFNVTVVDAHRNVLAERQHNDSIRSERDRSIVCQHRHRTHSHAQRTHRYSVYLLDAMGNTRNGKVCSVFGAHTRIFLLFIALITNNGAQ